MPRGVLLVLAGVHLVFVANAVTGLVRTRGSLGSVLGFYGNVTGADNNYTFFAPRVPDEVLVSVATFDSHGRSLPERNAPREERLRVSNYVSFLIQQGVPRLAAWTLANDAFARESQAERAWIVFSVHRMPTMSEYRKGQRPMDEPIYEGEFLPPNGG